MKFRIENAECRIGAGFTLAEVLITLGIIGIIAALTIPGLISSYCVQVVETRLKKVYSVMNQAIRLAQAENGDSWGLNCWTATCTVQERKDWFDKYIGKNLNSLKTEVPDDGTIVVYLTDGSILRFRTNLIEIDFYIDNRAFENPSGGVNQFLFNMNIDNIAYKNASGDNFADLRDKVFEPYCFALFSIDSRLTNPARAYSCTAEGSKAYCARLIQNNGWKIPKDYPFKF